MEKYKILIVEDDVDLREGLSFSFSGDGYDVTETGTKKDGLQEIANGGYDIVFLDCNLANDPNCDTSEPPLALGGSFCAKGVHNLILRWNNLTI